METKDRLRSGQDKMGMAKKGNKIVIYVRDYMICGIDELGFVYFSFKAKYLICRKEIIKHMKKIVLALVLTLSFSSYSFYGNNDLTQYVNPFVGTGGHGHTFPGATVPFGMVQLSPDTRLEGWDGCSGYHYLDSIIYGFSHTHLSGTGVPDYCDILFMPFSGIKNPDNSYAGNYTSAFSHSEEKAEPGYYSVLLKRNNIKAELTASTRAGFHRYTYQKGNDACVYIDLKHRDEVLESHLRIVNNKEISGLRRSKYWAKDQRVYFYAVFSEEMKEVNVYSDDKISQGNAFAEGKNVNAVLNFGSKDKPVMVKVGISAISEENAKMNLDAEINHWDFDKVREDANILWNGYLNKIQVKSDDTKILRVFYTALYHTAICPNTFNDVDGSYLGRDLKVHKANHNYYTVFSLWDTYRALHPLLNIIERKRSADFIKTFLLEYEQGGRLPVWELCANETDCMIGYHSVPVITDAFNSGINDFDTKLALDAMVSSANQNIYGLDAYRKYGYIPAEKEHESVSKTLEYAYDDWCISKYAGWSKNETYREEFYKRSQFYKNVFDPETMFMRPRYNNGWKSPFSPTDVDNNYTEANSYQYSFYVPQDVRQLSEYMKGDLEGKLDQLFKADSKTTGREQSDITGLIGQYAHGNEPSHHIAYLYNYTKSPHKTQELVKYIMKEFYTDNPDGLIGNEDCGQMSAWYVLSAMGFYPVTPGTGKFMIGSPIFDEVKINLESGKTFTLTANNVSDENFYVQNYTGEDKRPYITVDEILEGKSVEFVMGNKPAKSFGEKGVEKYMFEEKTTPDYNELIPSPYLSTGQNTFKDSLTISIAVNFPKADIYYNINGDNTPDKYIKYTKPFTIYENSRIMTYANSLNGTKYSYFTESFFNKVPNNVSVTLISKPGNEYTAGGPEALIDGLRGQTNWRLGKWQGYQGQDFEAVLKFKEPMEIKSVGAGFLQDARSWIWMPVDAEFYVSEDGVNYVSIGTVKNTVADTDLNVSTKDFITELNKRVKCSYIKVKAKNYGKIPSWHLGAGEDAYIFIDEIFYK